MTEAARKGYPTDIIFTDFAKAFDKVPHRRLLHKLKSYGVSDNLYKWIESWLTDRQQRVTIGNNKSDWKTVSSGVPQGSVLGPLLFLIYINDLPEKMQHHFKMYADDCKIIGVIESNHDIIKLQTDIDEAVKWSHTWLMSFNVDKCKVMHTGRSKKKLSTATYTMNNLLGQPHQLSCTSSERDLGVVMTSDLKVKKQVCTAASAGNRMLGRLKKAFRGRGSTLWRTLYTSYVRPHLEFAVQAWSPFLAQDIAKLEQVQRRATKHIATLKHLPYSQRLASLNLTTLTERRERGDLIEQYKITKNIDEVNFQVPQFQPNIEVSKYSLRPRGHTKQLKAQLVRNCVERNNFLTNRVVKSWNALSQKAVDSKNLNTFKYELSSSSIFT